MAIVIPIVLLAAAADAANDPPKPDAAANGQTAEKMPLAEKGSEQAIQQ